MGDVAGMNAGGIHKCAIDIQDALAPDYCPAAWVIPAVGISPLYGYSSKGCLTHHCKAGCIVCFPANPHDMNEAANSHGISVTFCR